MLLSNRYRIIEELGEGGFGKTYLGEDTQLPSKPRCVIKELKPVAGLSVEDVVKRFEQEAITLDKLGQNHDQIPRLFAYFAHNEQFYLVQEYVEGDTLSKRIVQNGPLSEMETYDLLCQVLSILCYIHNEGVIHRDIKPDNIILRASDGMPVLIDFGAVKEKLGAIGGGVADSGGPSRSIAIGTLGFMSTEQAIGRPVFSSDLFSLGMTAIYALTAQGPQSLPTNPSTGIVEWNSTATPINISSKLDRVLDRAIQPLQGDRYTSAQDMLVDLQNLNSTAPVKSAQIPRSAIPPTIAASQPIIPSQPITPSQPSIQATTQSPSAPGVPPTITSSPQPISGIPETTLDNSGANARRVAEVSSSVPVTPSFDSGNVSSPIPSNANGGNTNRSSAGKPWLIPVLIGVPVVGLAAFGVSQLLPNGDTPTPEVTPTPTQTIASTPRPSPPPTPTPSPLPTPPITTGYYSQVNAQCGADYCDMSIAPGFLPDPIVGTGNIGGEFLAENISGVANTTTGKCTGFVNNVPDHTVIITAPFEYLAIGLESPVETSLMIIDQTGAVLCYSDLNPFIEGPWPVGQYAVYTGNLAGPTVGDRYRVYATEFDPRNFDPPPLQ